MSQILNLPDQLVDALQQAAAASGMTPQGRIEAQLELVGFHLSGIGYDKLIKEAEEARLRFERHFGEIALAHPTGLENESIDADLARQYADDHAEE